MPSLDISERRCPDGEEDGSEGELEALIISNLMMKGVAITVFIIGLT